MNAPSARLDVLAPLWVRLPLLLWAHASPAHLLTIREQGVPTAPTEFGGGACDSPNKSWSARIHRPVSGYMFVFLVNFEF